MGRRTGFEPATSRVEDEVTAIFTTDRVESWRGTGDAVAAPKSIAELRHFCRRDSNPRPPNRKAGRRSYRSNSHLHHRLADAWASAIKKHAGERAISVSVTSTPVSPCGKTKAGARAAFARPLPRCVSQRRGSNPLFPVRSIRNLHHQRWLSRKMRQTRLRINSVAAL
jgi:hypothetical protein